MIEQEVREIRGSTVRTLQVAPVVPRAQAGHRDRTAWTPPRARLCHRRSATLALGIGGNVAVFSVVRSVLLRPLPYDRPEQLVQLWTDVRAAGGRAEPEWLSPRAVPRLARQQTPRFSGLYGLAGMGTEISPGAATPSCSPRAGVTWNFLDVLGVDVAMGRDFVQADDDAGAAPVVILTDGLWRRRFSTRIRRSWASRSSSPVSRGPLWVSFPRRFRAPFRGRSSVRCVAPTNSGCDRGCITLRGIGRLKTGVTLAQAQADLQTIQTRLGRDFPEDEANVMPWLVPLQEQLTGPCGRRSSRCWERWASCCCSPASNLAGLLVVRGGARAREFAVRASLGAGRRRIVRQLVTESLVLASIGGVIGFLRGVGRGTAPRGAHPRERAAHGGHPS
jgi:putative ABC transport system permease protein